MTGVEWLCIGMLVSFFVLLIAGVPVALSTDDEGVARSEMTMEYVRAAQQQLLAYREIKAMARASLRHSFADDELRTRLIRELDSAFVAFESRMAGRTRQR